MHSNGHSKPMANAIANQWRCDGIGRGMVIGKLLLPDSTKSKTSSSYREGRATLRSGASQ